MGRDAQGKDWSDVAEIDPPGAERGPHGILGAAAYRPLIGPLIDRVLAPQPVSATCQIGSVPHAFVSQPVAGGYDLKELIENACADLPLPLSTARGDWHDLPTYRFTFTHFRPMQTASRSSPPDPKKRASITRAASAE